MAIDLFNCSFDSDPPIDGAGHAITKTGSLTISGGVITYTTDGSAQSYISWTDDGYEDKDLRITITDFDGSSLPETEDTHLFMQGNLTPSGTLFIVQVSNYGGGSPDKLAILHYTVGGSSYKTEFTIDITSVHTFVVTRTSLVYSLTVDGTPASKSTSNADGKSFAGVIGQSLSGIPVPMGTAYSASYSQLQIEDTSSPSPSLSESGGIDPHVIRQFRRF